MSGRPSDIRQAVLSVPWIAEAGEEVLADLVAVSRLVSLRKGEELIHPGQLVSHLAVIASGAIESSMLSAKGGRHVTSVLFRGQVIGYYPMFLGSPANFSELAIEPTDVVLVPRDAVLRAMQRCLPVLLGVLAELSRRSNHLLQLLADQHLMSPRARVARGVMLLSSCYAPVPIDGAATPHVKSSQRNLGNMLGLTRQQVNLELKHLETMGLIALGYSTISIVDQAGLEAIVGAES